MIELRFVNGTGPVSSFIKFWTWGDWSHVDIKTPAGWLGARSDGGVQIRNWDYIGKNIIAEEIRSIELSEKLESVIMNWFYAQIGKPYDYLAVAGMPFRYDHDWRDSTRWFCSELAIAGFATFGVKLLDVNELNRVSPRDLALSPLLTRTQ